MITKVWGEEQCIVNCDEYCGKLLFLNKGATSSYHHHKEKQETFYVLRGKVELTVDGRKFMLLKPKTIMPNQRHSFYGITKSVIMEISTHHDDNDVYRETESSV